MRPDFETHFWDGPWSLSNSTPTSPETSKCKPSRPRASTLSALQITLFIQSNRDPALSIRRLSCKLADVLALARTAQHVARLLQCSAMLCLLTTMFHLCLRYPSSNWPELASAAAWHFIFTAL